MMAQVKFKSQEEFEAFKKKMASEVPPDNNPLATKGPEDQNVKVYTRPDMREGAEQPPSELSERAELNRKLRAAQMKKEEEPKTFSERHPKIAEAGEAIKNVGHRVKEELKRISKNAEKLDKKEPVREPEEEEEEEEPVSKKSKKSKKSKEKEDFGEDSESMPSRSSGKKPFSEDYKEVYSGKKVMSGEYKEVYRGQMGNEPYNPPKVPKTHEEQHTPRPQHVVSQPVRQKPHAPIEVPKIGMFNNSNIKMPTVSFGGKKEMPKVAMPSMGGKKNNLPSINVPTLGSSTLMVGSGLMGKTANNKIGVPMMNIPKIGNWGKSPLKTELNLPDIGNLTIMGAGKKGKGFGINMSGEIPKFGLAAPQKKKKV